MADSVRLGRLPPTLRLYGWPGRAISLGRRQRPEDLPSGILQENLPLVHRPTGGGAVLHDPDELTYAFCAARLDLPFGLSVRQIPGWFHRSLRRILVERGWVSGDDLQVVKQDPAGPSPLCFTAPACGDLLFRGRKVAGSALRVWKEGILLQGSLQKFPVDRDRLMEAFTLMDERGFCDEETDSFPPFHRCSREGSSLG